MALPTRAADALFAEHAPAPRHFLGARCRDPDLAADLLQETAARLVAAGPRLDANGNPRGYLFRIAANVWRDHVRREIVRRRTLDEVRQEGGAGGGAAVPAADQRVLERELKAAVRRAVQALPVAQREVVRLRHEKELRFQEIAERLGRPLGTVLTQMRDALAKIGAALESYR